MKVAAGILLALMTAGAFAQTPPTLPFVPPTSPPTIDGNLEAGEWPDATRVTGFIDIVTSAAAPEQTQAWLTSDAEFIYVAFACADSQPDTISARERQRGASFDGEDVVSFLIDPFASNRYNNQFEFSVNALGTQNERLGAGRATKQEWRGDWNAATQRNEHGWTAEIRIPWRMLDYPAGNNQEMQINFIRLHPRLRVNSAWADLTLAGRVQNLGRWTGVNAPVTTRERDWQGLIYAVPEYDEDAAKTFSLRSGFDLRYRPDSRLTGVLSVNPDFRNIEQAIADISFSRTERSLSDARPFFQEGQEYFNLFGGFTFGQLFYSRRIDDFDQGVKIFGTPNDRLSYGVLATREDGNQTDVVTRVAQRIGSLDSLSFFSTLSDGPARTDAVVGTQYIMERGAWTGTVRLARRQNGSRTSGAAAVGFDYTVPRFFVVYKADTVDADFRPSLGLINYQGTRRQYIYSEFSDPTIRGGIHGMFGAVYLDERRTQNDKPFAKSATFDGSILTAQDLRLGISLATSTFQGLPSRSAGLFFTVNERNRFSRFNGFVNGGVIDGDPSRYSSFRAEQRLAPGLDMALGWQQLDWRGKTEQTQLSLGYEINPYQSLNGRVVWQDGESNAYLAFRQGGREGLDVYFILGDANADRTRNRAALKLVWAF